MSYMITLQDAPEGMTELARHKAEEQFRRTLERAMGGADNTIVAYQAWQQAEEAIEADMSAEDIRQVKRWAAAAAQARNDGLRDIGETEAYFELKLEK